MLALIKRLISKLLILLHLKEKEVAASVSAQVIPLVAKVEAVPQEIKKDI